MESYNDMDDADLKALLAISDAKRITPSKRKAIESPTKGVAEKIRLDQGGF